MFEGRDAADVGFGTCPQCGEKIRYAEYVKNGVYNKGIMSEIVKMNQSTSCDEYTCYTCGNKWHSKAYRFLR